MKPQIEYYTDTENGTTFACLGTHAGRKHTIHDGYANIMHAKGDEHPYEYHVHGTDHLTAYFRPISPEEARTLAPTVVERATRAVVPQA